MHLKQTVKTLYLQQICGSKSIVANRNLYGCVANRLCTSNYTKICGCSEVGIAPDF